MEDFDSDFVADDELAAAGSGYAKEPLTLEAPLAQVAVEQARGLTLEDLEALHDEDSPEILELDAALSEELALEQDLREGNEELTSAHIFSADPAPARSVKVRVQKHGDDEESDGAPPERAAVLASLEQAFAFEYKEQRYSLNQLDDTRQLLKQAQHVLQYLPQYVDRLSQVMHAQAQCVELYEQLAQLSEQRGSAAEIMQTARQIEVLEKNLREKAFQEQELEQMIEALSQHQRLISHYERIFQGASQLSSLNLD